MKEVPGSIRVRWFFDQNAIWVNTFTVLYSPLLRYLLYRRFSFFVAKTFFLLGFFLHFLHIVCFDVSPSL